MDVLDRLLAHNEWATRVLLEYCRDLSEEEFKRECTVGPGSLHQTFAHIIGVMGVWADIITGRPPGDYQDLLTHCSKADDFLPELADRHESLAQACQQLHDRDSLDRIRDLPHPCMQMLYRFTEGSMATHVLTHGMHHRAQILQMLRQLGHGPEKLPDIDVLEWEIRESVGSREPLAG